LSTEIQAKGQAAPSSTGVYMQILLFVIFTVIATK
jgi:hypothetical protein